MCGIAGILLKGTASTAMGPALRGMADTMKHRGPDDEGYVCFGNDSVHICGGKDTQLSSREMNLPYAATHDIETAGNGFFLGFAHRRLSVIDLSSAGHQPMCNSNKSIWVVFNGEIYNYWEIREELESKSVRFISGSDVEVLIKAYEYWGMQFIEKLNGMWAFVLYDANSNTLIGCRDRFGVKPFYYYNSKQFFAFASEQKALMQLPVDTGINTEAVSDYLVNAKIERTEDGLYRNIKELMPSQYFVYDLTRGQFNITAYYSLKFSRQISRFDESESKKIVQQVKEKITAAVAMRLRSDVNVGFCLSGGIDSSSIIGISNKINADNHLRQLSGNLHAFTADCIDAPINETGWAEQVVKRHQLNWHKCSCTSGLLFDELEKIIYFQDSPLFSTSTYAQASVMKMAHEHNITILLDGQGGDELFGGYVPFYISYYFELLRHMRFAAFGKEISGLSNSPLNINIMMRSFAKVILYDILPQYFKKMIYRSNHQELSFMGSLAAAPAYWGDLKNREYSRNDLNTSLYNFFTQGYLRNLLRWEDRCSMQYSVESRTPFADDIELIEYVFSLPSVYKIHHGRSKYLLREAMAGVLPESIYNRSDKLGFATPQTLWLKQSQGEMQKIIRELHVLDTEKYVDSAKLLAAWDEIFSRNANPKMMDFVWRYMNFLMWRKINKM